MPHRSRLTAVIIDVEKNRFDEITAFWAGALGRTAVPSEDDRYTGLRSTREADVSVIMQRVDAGDEGLHLDIETDDVEAEVKRLEALGARRKRKVKTWWVMEDPSGRAFCVLKIQGRDWPAGAKEWP